MRTLLLLTLLVPTLSQALENCVEYPVFTSTEQAYKGEITSESSRLSFSDCPDSVLVNDKSVARLHKVLKSEDDEAKCVYKFNTVAFKCEK